MRQPPFSSIMDHPYTMLVLGIVLARIIPHPPNASLLYAFVFYIGWREKTIFNAILILVALLLSDIIIGKLDSVPILGHWSWFTYSGCLGLFVIGGAFSHTSNLMTRLIGVIGSTMGYWMWTNFGIWACGGLYPHDFSGLLTCYFMALPFLTRSLLSATMGYLLLDWMDWLFFKRTPSDAF